MIKSIESVNQNSVIQIQLFSLRIWETPSLTDGSSFAGVLPSTSAPLSKEKRRVKEITKRAVSSPLITMSSVTMQTIDEWVKEMDEFR